MGSDNNSLDQSAFKMGSSQQSEHTLNQLKELHTNVRHITQLGMSWFAFFVTVNYLTMGWLAKGSAHKSIEGISNVDINAGLLSTIAFVLVVQDVLGIVGLSCVLMSVRKMRKAIISLQKGQEQLKYVIPDRLYLVIGIGLILVLISLILAWTKISPSYGGEMFLPDFLQKVMPAMSLELWVKVIGAIGITVGLLLNWRTHSERSTFEMIDRLYSLCHTLENHLLNEWRLSHLFCMELEDYERTKIKVAKGLTSDERSELLIKEKLFAIHILIVYEQVLYQLNSSSRLLHRRRRKFLQEMLSYFAERLLLNPRLQGFISTDPLGHTLHLERQSMTYLIDTQKPILSKVEVKPDREGPFSEGV